MMHADTSALRYVPFPSPGTANNEGLLASGGNLSPSLLLSAYQQGIFPWFNSDQPVLWWSPDPRMVLYPHQIHISRTMRRLLRNHRYQVTCNHAFNKVILQCSKRKESWLHDSMIRAYQRLYQLGYGYSVEVWDNCHLVGGLYGIALGGIFFGESMFSRHANTSKIALIKLAQALAVSHYTIIDCQVASAHLRSMGAIHISREEFVHYLSMQDFAAKPQPFTI